MDLHVHSVYSDGLKTPEQLCALAGRLGIAYLALCDHDTVNGLDPMAQAVREENRARETRGQPPLTLIPCVEISTGPGGRTHLLAYGASPRNARLTAFLSGISAERRIRAGRMLERLEDAGLTREQLTDGVIWRSAGATCEELALLTFSDADGAGAAAGALETYLQAQIESNRDYRPAEIPKLEDAFLQASGETVLMVVSNDTQAVRDIVE